MMDAIEKARVYSRAAHQAVGQVRKYTGEPYYLHPEAVAERVSCVAGATTAMLQAALLHDVVEDTGVTLDEIDAVFGQEVAGLVAELTDQFVDPGLGSRKHRKKLERDRLTQVSPQAQTIKYADIIENAGSIARYDTMFAAIYLPEKKALLDVMDKGDPVLRREAIMLIDSTELPSPPH